MVCVAHLGFLLLAVGTAGAPNGVASADQEAYFDIVVNEQHEPSTLIVLRGDDVLVPPESLLDAGFTSVPGARVQVEGHDFVSLRSMAPGVTFAVNESELTVKVDAAPRFFAASQFDLYSIAKPANFRIESVPSLFGNYSLELTSGGDAGIFTELGASVGRALFTSGWSRPPGQHPVRGLTVLGYDDPERLRHWQLGESFVSTGVLGGSDLVAGIGVETNFALDPYRVHHPLPQLVGTTTTPSRLDVYVNGRLVRQETVNPGTFRVENLPAAGGAGSVQYVLQDAFGRSQTFSSDYYLASGLLAVDDSDFGYEFGFPRLSEATESFSYSPHPELLLRHRRGLTNWLTLGGRFEAGFRAASGGPTLAIGLPLGEIQANGSLSSRDHLFGAAGTLSYAVFTHLVSGGLNLQIESDHYGNVSQRADSDRPIAQVDAYLGVPVLRDMSVYATYHHQIWRDTGRQDSFELRADYSLTNGVHLMASAGQTTSNQLGNAFGGMLTLLVTFGKDGLAQAAVSRQASVSDFDVSVQKATPPYEGYGYHLDATRQSFNGDAIYAPWFGRFEANYSHIGSENNGSITASGGLIWIDHSVAATQPVQNGYALIEVPGIQGVHGMLNNQTVGTTSDKGKLLVPNVSAYVANRISILPTDVPMDYDLPKNDREIGIPFRAGTVVRFDARRITSLTGTIVMLNRAVEIPPQYGTLDVDVNGTTKSSPLGKDGAFYLENVPPGRYVGQVHSDPGDCVVSIEVPPETSRVIDLGKITCPKIPAPVEAKAETP